MPSNHPQLTTQAWLWLEQLPITIAVFDRNMQYLLANSRWRELLNLGSQSLNGCSYTQTISIVPPNWLTIQKNCLSGLTQSWQTEYLGDEESLSKSLKWQAAPWRNQADQIDGITVSVEAILEEEKVTSPPELQTFKQFEALADNVPGMIYQFRQSPDGTRTFPYVSSGCRCTYEVEPEQVYLQPELLFEMIHPEDLPRLENAIAYSAQTLTEWEFEWRIITPTGKLKWLKGISQPQYQPDGAILWNGCVMEISDRKLVEAALKQLNQELKAIGIQRADLLQQSLQELTNLKFALDQSASVSVTDLEGNIIYINDKFCQLSGYNYQELIGKNHNIISSDYHSPQFFQEMWQTISQGYVWRGEIKNKAKDGSYYWLDTTIVPLLNEKYQPYQYISIRHDISDRKIAEIALKESQNQLQAVLDHAPAVIFLKNTEGEYIIANPECERVFQASPGEVIGKTDYDFLPQEIADLIQYDNQYILKTAQDLYSEEVIPHLYSEEVIPLPDGEHIYQMIKFPVRDARGEIYATGGVYLDITSRKAAENALKQSEAHFQRLTANIPGMLYQYRLDAAGNFSFPYISSGCRDIFGVEPELLQQDNSILKIHPEDDALMVASILLSAETLQNWEHEWRIVLPSGQVKWLQGFSRPEKQADGSILWDGCLIDISDRVAAEAQLQQFQQRLSLMIEQTPLAVIEWNIQMEVTAWNPAAERIFGYTYDEALGQYIDFIVPESTREQVQKIVDDLLLQQGGYCNINDNLRKDGTTIVCEWYNTPLVTDQGEVIGIASHALDITERKQAEIQLQQQTETLRNTLQELRCTQAQMIQSEKMSSLGRMVAGVAHEINNPISFIHGNLTYANSYIQDLFELLDLYQTHYPKPVAEMQEYLEEIELDFLKEDFSKLLNSMKTGTERIREIVLSLRNFSRLDESEFKLADIHQGINSTLMILKNRLYDIEVIKEYGDLPQVECYPGQLNQVFMNILENAIYILEKIPGDKIIMIQTETIDYNWIRIKFANSGPEISSRICDKVFDPFFTTKPTGEGTGLGLSTSYQIIIERHHGKIYCYPVPNVGTEFIIEIPVQQIG
ncbi:MAG: PAS domain S-box protein [Microcoleaceae cyanobacterium]